MKRINVAKKFRLHTTDSKLGGHQYTDYAPGSHVVPDDHADHWYTKLHLQPESEKELELKMEEANDTASEEAKEEAPSEEEEAPKSGRFARKGK